MFVFQTRKTKELLQYLLVFFHITNSNFPPQICSFRQLWEWRILPSFHIQVDILKWRHRRKIIICIKLATVIRCQFRNRSECRIPRKIKIYLPWRIFHPLLHSECLSKPHSVHCSPPLSVKKLCLSKVCSFFPWTKSNKTEETANLELLQGSSPLLLQCMLEMVWFV